MTIKLNVGLSKKVGLPDYGSLGASCHVEMDLDAELVEQDLDEFHRRVQDTYVACSQAVNDELARHTQHQPQLDHATPARNGNGSSAVGRFSNGNGNGHSTGGGRLATDKQLGYIRQLAGQIRGLGVRRLDTISDRMFAKSVAELSGMDASGLIDMLKEIKAGNVELESALNGAAS